MNRFSEFVDWAVIVGLTLVVLLTVSCGSDPKHQPLPPTQTFETSKGATVYVIQGDNPTTEDLAEIDRQISRITEIATEYAKQNGKTYLWPGHGRHVIDLVLPNNGPGECETPGSFFTDAGQYGGEQICVAGRYYPATDRIRTTLTALRTSKSVQFESEHFGLKYNDEALYKDTLTHVPCPPKCHPIFRKE